MKMELQITASCTWTRTGGCEVEKAIQTEISHEDVFYKPALGDILRDEHAVLLAAGNTTAGCELELALSPCYKIGSVHCLCSASKVELFLGAQKEYTETVYGTLLDDDDDRGANKEQRDVTDDAITEEEVSLKSYRYDIEIVKSGVVALTLKFLTTSKEICLFGLLLLLGPNPCGVTTLAASSAGSAINLGNVQEMLSSSKQKLSPCAEKCKLFIETYNKSKSTTSKAGIESAMILEHMKEMMSAQMSHTVATMPLDAVQLQAYIDARLTVLETRLTERLDKMEAQQSEKLDAILNAVQKL